MDIVLLADVQSGFGSQWVRIANTAGVKEIKIGDCFREQGFGEGSEEFKVAGVDISPIGGASKIFVDRGANATPPMTHRLGAVMEQVRVPITWTAPTGAKELEPAINAIIAHTLNPESALPVSLDEGFPEPAMTAVGNSRTANAERQRRFREKKKIDGYGRVRGRDGP